MTTEFRVLGEIEARVDGQPVDLGHSRQRCVLATLLVAANRVVSTDQLVDRVWAEHPPHRAKDTLYGYLHRLRKNLAGIAEVDIVRRSGGYLIAVDENLIDLHRFHALLSQARAADDEAALELFAEALALWRGDAFAGMDIPWLNDVRDNLNKERFTAQLDYTDLRLKQGQHAELVTELAARAEEHQWDERLAGQLMLALYRSGRQAEALAQYQLTRTRLAEHLGIDPSPALRQLHQHILTADSALTAPNIDQHETAETQLDRAARELATAVARQWTAEAELRSLRRPAPLRVRWSATGRPVTATEQLTLRGDLTDVVAKFRKLPVRQLVVLGEPGAGKTVLAILLTLGLLADRRPDDPTPVLLPLSSWNPHRDHLHTWLARRLLAEYPGLGNVKAHGRDAATRLVTEGRIVPVFDGLDETAPELHAAAIDAIDQAFAGDRPLVVTCRSTEYEKAVRDSGALLASAAVVEIEPVELDDAITFLTARHRIGDTRWQPVVEHLRRNRSGPLAEAFSTPLMVDLARTAYHHPASNPAELLDLERFPDRDTIKHHLIDEFLPASYTQRPAPPAQRATPRYQPEQAKRWLTFLAGHLRQQHTTDFAWWRLPRAIPKPVKGFVFALPAALLFAITGLLVAGPVMAAVYGISTGLSGYVAHGWGTPARPVRVEVRFRGTTLKFLGRFAIGIVISLAIGFAWSLPAGSVVLLAAVFGFGMGVQVWLEAPTEATQASSPVTTQRQDRIAALAYALSVGLALGLFYALTIAVSAPSAGVNTVAEAFHVDRAIPAGLVSALFGWFAFRRFGVVPYGLAGLIVGGQVMPHHIPLGLGLVAGAVFGTAICLIGALSRSWGCYVFSRVWLAMLGRTPWRLNRFLADAHQRGVLRQAGAMYQFRHARLQDRLVSTTPATAMD